MQAKIIVSASEVAEVVRCQKRLINKLHGVRPDAWAISQSKFGNREHERHNRIGADKRCFVATYLFKENHEIVREFRTFRDGFLKKTLIGNVFVKFYYSNSHILIYICEKNPLFKSLMTKVLKCIYFLVR